MNDEEAETMGEHRGWSRRRVVVAALGATLACLTIEAGVAGAALWTPFANVESRTAAASRHVSPLDRRSTGRFLRAQYAYEKAWQASEPAAKADLEALEQRLEGECPGVVAGALALGPQLHALGSSGHRSARQRGEENRLERQRSELRGEVSGAVAVAVHEPSRAAFLSFAQTLDSLRWSSPELTRLMHAGAAIDKWEATAPAPDICADMTLWAQSGYTTVSPATKALAAERAKLIEVASSVAFLKAILTHAPLSTSSFEDASQKRLASKIARVQKERDSVEAAADARVLGTLGLISAEEAQRLSEPEASKPSGGPGGSKKRADVIQKGRSAAGGRYAISIKPRRKGKHGSSGCSYEVEVKETSGKGNNGSWGVGTCVSDAHPQMPEVGCMEGTLTVQFQLPADVRKVRLVLSNGRSITSAVARVPKRLGGPAGVYYQALRGPKPYPVSLIELGPRGKALRTLKLRERKHCVSQSPPSHSPSDIRKIASGTVGRGTRFSFVGVRMSGSHEIHIGPYLSGGLLEELILALGGSEGMEVSVPEGNSPHAKPLASAVYSGCRPHEYAIAYGVLRDVKDQVLVRSEGKLVRLRRSRIPASLHVEGVLVYAALPKVPSEILLRTPSGRTTVVKRLGRRVSEARELCEGEAEPGG